MKRVMHRQILLITALFLLGSLMSCQSLVVKKPSAKINNLALISFYINNNIDNLDEGHNFIDLDLGDSVAFEPITANEKVMVEKTANESFQLFINQWNQVKNQKLLSLKDYVSTPAYKNFTVVENNQFDFEDETNLTQKFFSAPKRISIIPLQRIVESKNTSQELPSSVFTYADLADLAKKLNVDGVLIVKNEIAYFEIEKRFYPKVGFQILLVTKDEEVLINTPNLSRKTGLWFRGKKVSLNENEKIENNDDNLKNILDAYQKGINYLLKKIVLE